MDKIEDRDIKLSYLNRTYKIFIKGEKYKFKTSKCKMPFGIERYNNKDIINLEFDTNMNDGHNYIAMMKHCDKIFSKIQESGARMQKKFIEDIQDKYYITSLKERDLGKVHHRCHVKKGTNIDIILDEKYKESDIYAEIEMENIWISKDMFGIVWMITKIDK